jgi:4-diphosphocytidyl-2C-methyl-D-erythritol kinase
MLRFLAKTFGAALCRLLGVTESEFDTRMMKVALEIGADIPYAYRAGICWVTGIGEQVIHVPTVAPWPGEVLITMPPVSVPTVDFYRFFREQNPVITETTDPVMERIARGDEPLSCAELLANDFEATVAKFRPEVGEALRLAREYYPNTTSVTGSGAAIISLVPPEQRGLVPAFQRDLEAHGMTAHPARMLAAL